jgi:hypothetical protein
MSFTNNFFFCRSSVVGSIGVISGGLGFHEFINKYGIGRDKVPTWVTWLLIFIGPGGSALKMLLASVASARNAASV